MSSIFCIVSAIGNQYGVFTYKQRLQQLIESIDSIKKYAPGSDIVIFDASEDPLPQQDVELLNSMVNMAAFIYDNKYIQFLKYNSKDPTPNKFEKKTVGEIEATKSFLEFLKTHPIKYDRVFKLTGRFKLNENFNLNDHLINKDKCVFLEKEDWCGSEVYLIRLWSFDYNNLDTIYQLFNTVQNETYDHVTKTGVLNVVEYSITKYIEELKIPVQTVKVMGVEGLHGQDANPCYE